MSDLTEYDREIVAAAELWVDHRSVREEGFWVPALQRLIDLVQAKRDAQRPRCNFWAGKACDKPAVQSLYMSPELALDPCHRCVEHSVEVREL